MRPTKPRKPTLRWGRHFVGTFSALPALDKREEKGGVDTIRDQFYNFGLGRQLAGILLDTSCPGWEEVGILIDTSCPGWEEVGILIVTSCPGLSRGRMTPTNNKLEAEGRRRGACLNTSFIYLYVLYALHILYIILLCLIISYTSPYTWSMLTNKCRGSLHLKYRNNKHYSTYTTSSEWVRVR
jgi:hypothetical protein